MSISPRLQRILNSETRIEAFDFVRSTAAISVIITHFDILDTYSLDIDAFFILSGFLVTQLLCIDQKDVNKRYFIGRFTKIIPSYFFFLISAYLVGSLFFSEIYGENLPKLSEWKQYFFFYRNYGGLPNRWAFEHVWTLCVEEHFYILVLLLSVVSKTRTAFRSNMLYFLSALIFLSILSKVQAQFTSFAEYPTYTHNRLDSFGYGSLLFLMKTKVDQIGFLKKASFLILCIALITMTIKWDSSEHMLWLRIVAPLTLTGILIYLMQFRFHALFRVMAYYSYNAYLWHFFILIPIVHYYGYSWVGFLLYFFLSVFLAILTTHLIEDFFITRRKQIFNFVFRPKSG